MFSVRLNILVTTSDQVHKFNMIPRKTPFFFLELKKLMTKFTGKDKYSRQENHEKEEQRGLEGGAPSHTRNHKKHL